ncbi:MAG: RNA polymerase sigma-54 factor, partial [Duncaniella sp.]|nr:RNA polymerase sigma-54 factor [Duncaniella sp.]
MYKSPDCGYTEPVAVAAGESLMESLMSQLAQTDLDRRQLAIASYIVGNLDDNGYMTRTLPQIEDDLAIDAGIEVSMDELKEIFARIRSLDPAGVGAYDLRDCLSLQLRRLPDTPAVKVAREIVADYFDIFSLRHFDRLAAALGVSRDELREADEVIRSLDPKPASLFGESDADERARHIIPDFYVDVDQNDRITVTMPNNIPELAIERSFDVSADNTVRESDMSRSRREALAFISRKRQEASDFIDLLRMRRVTLMNVMEAIARIQREFFITEDEGHLRPMVLKDIAAITGQDISVISRATAGKYVATPACVYPLKFFFNERPMDDDDISSREIMDA